MRVLLVEDNALTRHTLKALLARLGHEVVAEAEDGGKAVKYFSEFKPDVVFLDLILPGKSGLEVLEDLRKLDPQARVVVITAVDQDEVDRGLQAKGVQAILRKPFSFDDFKEVLKGLGAAGDEPVRPLEGIVTAGMARCEEKLSGISEGKWTVAKVRVSQGSMDEIVSRHTVTGASGFAVYFSVAGDCPFTSMAIFRPEDVNIISRGFLGTPQLPGLRNAQDFLFSGLASIILNSIISALSNKLQRAFLPAAPKCMLGETRFLLEALWGTLDAGQRYSAASITLDLKCGADTTRCEIVVVIPESLDKALAAG